MSNQVLYMLQFLAVIVNIIMELYPVIFSCPILLSTEQ